MVFVWSNLTDGEPNFILTQVALNDTIMVFAFAPMRPPPKPERLTGARIMIFMDPGAAHRDRMGISKILVLVSMPMSVNESLPEPSIPIGTTFEAPPVDHYSWNKILF
jgi:hypothetical protein